MLRAGYHGLLFILSFCVPSASNAKPPLNRPFEPQHCCTFVPMVAARHILQLCANTLRHPFDRACRSPCRAPALAISSKEDALVELTDADQKGTCFLFSLGGLQHEVHGRGGAAAADVRQQLLHHGSRARPLDPRPAVPWPQGGTAACSRFFVSLHAACEDCSSLNWGRNKAHAPFIAKWFAPLRLCGRGSKWDFYCVVDTLTNWQQQDNTGPAAIATYWLRCKIARSQVFPVAQACCGVTLCSFASHPFLETRRTSSWTSSRGIYLRLRQAILRACVLLCPSPTGGCA